MSRIADRNPEGGCLAVLGTITFVLGLIALAVCAWNTIIDPFRWL
jgi:hypothetical protein